MDAELKARWVKALRSGEYQQGNGQLRSEDCFCCLGVLCDLIDPNGWKNVVTGEDADFVRADSIQSGFLSKDLREEIGLRDPFQLEVARMNDAGTSFAEIADYIEANL